MAHSVTNIERKREGGQTPPEVPPRGSSVAHPRPGSKIWALNVVGIGAILAICYFGEETLVVLLVSVLLAFILDPVADLFTWLRIPRSIAAALAVILLIAAVGALGYVSVNKASSLVEELPQHSSEIRREISNLAGKAQKLEAINPAPEKGTVKVRETPTWTDLVTRGFGSMWQAVVAATFIPFLVYFMLTWQEHARRATLGLVSRENRRAAYVTLGLISAMIRSFILGNLMIGLIMGSVSTIVFGTLHIPFFYFAGFLSGFFSLVPYLGNILALLPPLFLAIGHLTLPKIVFVVLTVFGLHLVAINFLYPKILGGRLRLNPLSVAIALLVWGFLWGAAGLILAIPITGGMKIVFDHVEPLKPFGAWLGAEQPPNGDAH